MIVIIIMTVYNSITIIRPCCNKSALQFHSRTNRSWVRFKGVDWIGCAQNRGKSVPVSGSVAGGSDPANSSSYF